MLQAPGVHHHIARSAVEPDDLSLGRQAGEITNPTDVDNETMNLRMGKQDMMKRRDQGRTLASRGYITTSKVRHHSDAAEFSQ